MLDYLMLAQEAVDTSTGGDPGAPLKYLALMAAMGIIALFLSYVLVLINFYKACEMDEALVRSGAGGPKVAIQGGLWKFPYIHKFQRVTLRTLKLDVRSGRKKSKKDESMRGDGTMEDHEGSESGDGTEGIRRGMGVIRDVEGLPIIINAEFYVHVPAKEDYVINAAKTMGEKADPKYGEGRGREKDKKRGKAYETVAVNAIRDFAEEKLWGALRGVAGAMKLVDMHSDRLKFTDNVANALEQDLKENGLELESVAIESLDQEPLSSIERRGGEGNLFEEKALTKITQELEKARSQRDLAKNEERLTRERQDTEYQEGSKRLEVRRKEADYDAEKGVRVKAAATDKEIAAFEAETHRDKINVVKGCELESSTKIAEVGNDLVILYSDLEKNKRTTIAKNETEFGNAELDRDENLEMREEKTKQEIELRAIQRVATVGDTANQCKQRVGVAKEEALAAIGLANEDKLLRISKVQEEVASAETETNKQKALSASAFQSITSETIQERLRGELELPALAKKRELVTDSEAKRDQDVLVAQGVVAIAHGDRDSDLAKGAAANAILSRGQAEAESRRLDGEADKVYAQAEVIREEKELLNDKTIAKYLYAKNAPQLAGHLKDAVAAAFKPMEGMIDGFKILQVNTDGGSEGGPFGDVLRTITRNAPAGAILNEMLSMSGTDLTAQDLVEKLFGTIATIAGKSSSADSDE